MYVLYNDANDGSMTINLQTFVNNKQIHINQIVMMRS